MESIKVKKFWLSFNLIIGILSIVNLFILSLKSDPSNRDIISSVVMVFLALSCERKAKEIADEIRSIRMDNIMKDLVDGIKKGEIDGEFTKINFNKNDVHESGSSSSSGERE